MGDPPGTGEPGTAPEAFQPSKSPSPDQNQNQNHDAPNHPPPSNDLSNDLQSRELRRQKRSSLPARPHAAARHSKRLTLNFPISIPPDLLSEPSSASPGSMTPIGRSSAHQSPVPVGSPPLGLDDKDDGSGILTAIASQERKVLELKEELQRAETELDSLKKQWAQSEKSKKRTEINYRAEPLVPLKTPDQAATGDPLAQHNRERSGGSVDSPSATQARLSRELERRQSLRSATNKGTTISSNGRRVFQGSHARTLSLLSAGSGPTSGKPPGSESPRGHAEAERMGRPPRSATLPSLERMPVAMGDKQAQDAMSQWGQTLPPPSRDMLMRTGKQMASDLREGLWTFLEDIRQATVGEEGINATETRTMRSSSSKSRSRDRLSVQGDRSSRSSSTSQSKGAGAKLSGKDSKSVDLDMLFWSEFGIDTPGQTSPRAQEASNNQGGTTDPDASNPPDVDDNWDDWESPQPKKTHTPSSSHSTLASKHDRSPTTQNSSPRTSTSLGDWRATQDVNMSDPNGSDGIPWPAITKLAPSKLTRTASNLMAEWERSLSQSPERRHERSPSLDKDHKND
ncbi:uncharacterized protein BDW47DRAFT_110889 [Aspergillus candidus]|uniref:DUF4048 domain-containing protein n=1 Tax=Aspergillus candidus TaxID=41067 RepID=A0A2I2F3I4_ASPCN|nr:hypothetical protein BDW47DRAFT_110889 [Aspergillus candidus]PLB35201.1 hypothetical protein BDW47DRAFT_110889 [Aspergillus candidus]